ncbi:MAG: hypothetical protein FJY56_12915 [Betaproteobacteria bacterium]|nr:hypothetical protein [Betaproteobacteria bacterium]
MSAILQSTAAVTPASLIEAAHKLAPLVREHADGAEKNREMPRAVYEAIADAGILLMSAPRNVGGHEVDLPTHVRIIEILAEADVSTAWAVNQGATYGWYASRMDPAGSRAVWTDTPRTVVANSPIPTGKAIVVPGGYRVTAKQGFSTGSTYAPWIAAHATVYENGEVRMRNGIPETRYCLTPRAQMTLHDTWKTRGMRGTGTQTIEVKDVFVPEERTVFSAANLPTAPQICGGVRYKIPLTLNFAMGDTMAAIGLARRCISAFCDLAGAKAPRHMQGLLRDQAIAQFAMGEAEGILRSARAFTLEAVQDLWEDTVKTGAASMEKRAHARLASIHGIRSATQVIERLYPLCGGDSIFEGGLIQRCFQDIHVITQHVQGRLLNIELVGKYKLGVLADDPRI